MTHSETEHIAENERQPMITYTLSEAGIAHINLDDGKANALGPELISAFLDAISKAESEA